MWINQYPDYEADKEGNKRNGVVRLGKEKAANVYASLFFAAYASLVILAVVSSNPFWLLPFVTLSMVLRAFKVAKEHFDFLPKQIEANIRTIQTYQLTGLTMVIAALMTRVFV